jgi:thymidylate kinase
MAPLAALIGDPDVLQRASRRGRLPYWRALALAARSPRARRALDARISARLRILAPRCASRRRHHGRLIALSGMDGAGKSTHTEALSHHLTDLGISIYPAIVRIGRATSALDRIAIPLKRVLRTDGLSDPVATSPETAGPDALPSERPHGGLAWCWAIIVAADNVRTGRRIARVRRRGVTVVSDRWLADHLVDFDLRYGRHWLARTLLRAGMPRLDLAILLLIDPTTSAARKPGDQAPGVLRLMHRGYAGLIADLDLVAIDGTAPHEQVRAAVLALGESVTESDDHRTS